MTGGSRTALERHQTLFALIEWSHNLLSEAERVLLRRLSVFAGGWSFDAAQVVCGDGIDATVLDTLAHLVDKSLVAVEEPIEAAEGRYHLLETIRQYARDKLFESGEAEQVRDRHLEFFLRFAEAAEPKLRGGEQLDWLERVETEHDNLRTALAWSLESGRSEGALRLAGALYYFWELRGYWSEGQKWLEDALALAEREQSGGVAVRETAIPARAEAARRAKALYAAAWLHFATAADLEIVRTLGEESLRLWRELGDKWWMAVTLESLGALSLFKGDIEAARAWFEAALSLARELEDRWPLALCLIRLADPLMQTDVAAAHRILEEGVAVARRVGDKSVLSQGLLGLGSLYYLQGNLPAAASVVAEALAEARATRSISNIALSLLGLVLISCLQGDPAKAKGFGFELLALARETGYPAVVQFALLAFGFVASISGQPGRAVRLLAAFEAFTRQRGFKLPEGDPVFMVYKQALEMVLTQLGPAAFEAARAEGQQMTLEQALALATENEGDDLPLPKDGPVPSSD